MDAVTKPFDIAYGRFSAPDLDRMEAFLVDFGMVRHARSAAALHMRGTDAFPCIHLTEQADKAAFLGFGLKAGSLAELEALARHAGVEVTDGDPVIGGKQVTLIDPDGYRIDVIHGATAVAELPVPEYHPVNSGPTRVERNTGVRRPCGPAHVKRLGHAAVLVTDMEKSLAWYRETFGLLPSDYCDHPINGVVQLAGVFMRCDRGETPTDHHTVLLQLAEDEPGLQHLGYEVADLDDLMIGNAHLQISQHKHMWGIGRHTIGSQLFDYWRDPWGHGIEHWTDGDMLKADVEPGRIDGDTALLGQWGPQPSKNFGKTFVE